MNEIIRPPTVSVLFFIYCVKYEAGCSVVRQPSCNGTTVQSNGDVEHIACGVQYVRGEVAHHLPVSGASGAYGERDDRRHCGEALAEVGFREYRRVGALRFFIQQAHLGDPVSDPVIVHVEE